MISNETKEQVNLILSNYSENPILEKELDFSKFLENKKDFFQDFGERLIIKKSGEFAGLSNKEVDVRFNFFLEECIRVGEDSLRDFIIENGEDGFLLNKVQKNFGIPCQSKGVRLIKEGMKLSKAFGFFVEAPAVLDYLQTLYSKKISGANLDGNLCISIHPLDYLSMSMNNYGWRSCQALDGEFASGPLSLMNDSSTIIVYLEGFEESLVFDRKYGPEVGISWSNKKWRVLVHVSKDRKTLVFSKHYPSYMDGLEEEVVKMLSETFNKNFVKTCEKGTSFVRKGKDSLQYMDIRGIANESEVGLAYCHEDGTDEEIVIGESVSCLACHGELISEPGVFLCDDCGPEKFICCYCDYTTNDQDEVSYVGDSAFCEHCLDDYFFLCSECYDWIPRVERVDEHLELCECCYNTYIEENESEE